MPISKPHSSFGGNNKGSCSALVNYLDKENQELEKLSINAKGKELQVYFQERQQPFFSHSNEDYSKIEVRNIIDNNNKKLGKEDAKFFAPTISFSEKELQQIVFKTAGKKDIKNVSEMNKQQFVSFNYELKKYGREVMNNYAKNFNRQSRGIIDGSNLVYFGKVEHQRKFRGTDKEVLEGEYKAGDLKPGFQSHIHLIVSRKDITQKTKLSPVSNEKNTDRKIGSNNYKVGFDRKNWTNLNEMSFDKTFDYNRGLGEKFETQNTLKNGTPEEKHEIKMKLKKEEKTQDYGKGI